MTAAARQVASAASAPVDVLQTTAPPADRAAPGAAMPWPVSPASAAPVAMPVRLQASAQRLVLHAHYRIARLGLLGQVGLAALAAAALLAASVLLPIRHSLQTLRAELANTHQAPVAAGSGEAAPALLASLPTRAQMPQVIGQILVQASEAGVSLDTGHYAYASAKGGTVARYELDFPVKAAYPQIRSFIDRTLAAVPAAALGKLRLERKAVGDAVVGADIVFTVFVRAGEQR